MGWEPKRYHHMVPVGSVRHHCIDSWAGDPVVELLHRVWPFATPWTAAPGFPVLRYLRKFAQIHIHLVRYHWTVSSSVTCFSSPQSFPASGSFPMSWLFASGGQKYWSFCFSISPSDEYSGLISFRVDWFDLLAVQRALKSLLQHHNLKALILWHSAFFMVLLSYLYMTIGKPIALTR